MAIVKKSIFIEAPVEEVFAYADNPANSPEYWPNMLEVSDITKAPSGGHRFNWKYKMVGITINGSTDTIEHEVNKRFVIENTSGVELTGIWTFEPEGTGTRFSIMHDYKIPVFVLGRLAEPVVAKANEGSVEVLLNNVKAILEG